MLPRTLCLAVIVSWAGFVHADDWPEFRGPTGQGHANGAKLPTEWSKTQNVAWKAPIEGLGWSSPIVVSNRIVLTTAVPDAKSGEHSLRTICLNASDGKVHWDVEIFKQPKGSPRPHGKNSHASPTAIAADGKLYVHFGHMGTACLDMQGKILWKQADLKYSPVHGNGGSPILVDDRLIFISDGGDKQFIAALEASTGKVLWKTPREFKAPKPFAFCTPLLIEVAGKKQVVAPGANAVVAYDPVDGKEIWKVQTQGYSTVPRPVFGLGLVFISSGYDPPSTLMAIRPDGTGDVTKTHVEWQTKKGAPLTPSPLLIGNELYVIADNGNASCLDAKTGKVHWNERVGGAYSASPLHVRDRIYFQSEDGKMTAIRAATKYEVVGRGDLGEKSLASFAVADGALYARTEKHLYRIESSDK
ncbi:MAG: PQQ-binding-like beta-propeller repeat protein [Gemmataceae bacterium]